MWVINSNLSLALWLLYLQMHITSFKPTLDIDFLDFHPLSLSSAFHRSNCDVWKAAHLRECSVVSSFLQVLFFFFKSVTYKLKIFSFKEIITTLYPLDREGNIRLHSVLCCYTCKDLKNLCYWIPSSLLGCFHLCQGWPSACHREQKGWDMKPWHEVHLY